jgi:hypothetical protein
MPYIAPTPADIKIRFPELESIADARIAMAIEDAKRLVDQSWHEGDYGIALRYLTAHILVSEGALTGSPAHTGAIVSESLGDASFSYASPTEGFEGGSAEFATTVYGKKFLKIRRDNHPAVAVI